MRAADQQVRRNGGAPGIDRMSVEELGQYLKGEWQRIRESLLADRYRQRGAALMILAARKWFDW